MSNIQIENSAGMGSLVAQPLRLTSMALLLQAAVGCSLEVGTMELATALAGESQRIFSLQGADGTADPSTLAHGAFQGLALWPPYLYTVDDDLLVRVSTDGGTLEAITAPLATIPYQMVTDGAYLYGALFIRPQQSEFWRIPLSGGGFDTGSGGLLLGMAGTAAALGVNTSQLVALGARPSPRSLTRSITTFDKQGGGAQTLGTFTSVVTDAFALDDEHAYFTRGAVDLDHGEILRVALGGGEPEVLLSAPADTFRSLAKTGDDLAFASLERVGGVPARGGPDFTLSSDGAYLVLADEQFMFYFTWEPGCASGSDLYRVSRDGGSPVAIAHESAAGCIQHAVADDGAVYWLTADGTQLRKADKR